MSFVSAQYHRTTGLGNKLFPWARAKVFANLYGIKMLRSRWVSIRRGALLRGGIKYSVAMRKIWLLGNFKASPEEVRLSKREISALEPVVLTKLNEIQGLEGQKSYQFKWDACHEFSDLWDHREFLKTCFLEICGSSQGSYIRTFDSQDFIAMNIRTGKDFKKLSSEKVGYYLTEISWFEAALPKIRSAYGNLPVYIVSDGGKKDLAPLLKLANVNLVKTKTAVADLQILLKSKVLLGSGNSSFSAWASFMGGMDTYSSPETPFGHFKIAPANGTQKITTLEV